MKGTEQIAQRMVEADSKFVSMLVENHGITKSDAEKVLAVYYKLKVAKRDALMGRVNVVHGAYLDEAAIHNAIAWKE